MVSFFELKISKSIAQPLLHVWKYGLGSKKICMCIFWGPANLADTAGTSADFDPYILVTKIQISWIFEKLGLYVKEVGPTSKKNFFPKHLYLCILSPKSHVDSAITHVAIDCKKLVVKMTCVREPIFALTVNPLREVGKRTMWRVARMFLTEMMLAWW